MGIPTYNIIYLLVLYSHIWAYNIYRYKVGYGVGIYYVYIIFYTVQVTIYTKVLCGTGHFDCAWCILFFSLFAAVNNTRMNIKTGCSRPCMYTLYRIIYYEYNVYYVHNIATVLYYINMRTPRYWIDDAVYPSLPPCIPPKLSLWHMHLCIFKNPPTSI